MLFGSCNHGFHGLHGWDSEPATSYPCHPCHPWSAFLESRSRDHTFIPEWGADAFRLAYDSTALRPVRVEVRSTVLDAWINMGQFVNPNVGSYFFDIGPTNDTRFYGLSIAP